MKSIILVIAPLVSVLVSCGGNATSHSGNATGGNSNSEFGLHYNEGGTSQAATTTPAAPKPDVEPAQ